MSRMSIAASLLALISAAPCAAQQPAISSAPSGRQIIIFGASWCAPCIAELRDLARLAAAAQSDRLVVAWLDDRIDRMRLARAANVEIVTPDQSRRLMMRYGGLRTGLPYATMTRYPDVVCAEHRGGLSPQAVSVMRRDCETSEGRSQSRSATR